MSICGICPVQIKLICILVMISLAFKVLNKSIETKNCYGFTLSEVIIPRF